MLFSLQIEMRNELSDFSRENKNSTKNLILIYFFLISLYQTYFFSILLLLLTKFYRRKNKMTIETTRNKMRRKDSAPEIIWLSDVWNWTAESESYKLPGLEG